MITSIRMEGLRGICSGTVEGLGPLSVLVGPNGCGKSTVLDGLLLAGSGSPGDAVGRVVVRRVEMQGGARWLFWRGGRTDDPSARIDLAVEGAPLRTVTLQLLPDVETHLEEKLEGRRAKPPYLAIETTVTRGDQKIVAQTALAHGDNAYVFSTQGGSRELRQPGVRLVDPRPGGTHAPLFKSFSDAVEDGLLGNVEAALREVVPGFDRLYLLSDDAGLSILHLGLGGHSVPVAVAGDGIQTLVQVSLAVAQRPGSTVLLEEPEATQHPGSLDQSARAIVAAVRRGVQVILSTHSLDLIDLLRGHLGEDLSTLSVHHLACRDGALSALRYSGAEVALARDAIGEDLR